MNPLNFIFMYIMLQLFICIFLLWHILQYQRSNVCCHKLNGASCPFDNRTVNERNKLKIKKIIIFLPRRNPPKWRKMKNLSWNINLFLHQRDNLPYTLWQLTSQVLKSLPFKLMIFIISNQCLYIAKILVNVIQIPLIPQG